MKKFKVYGFSIIGQKVLITNSESISLASTFDEQLKLQRYMKSDFSFKISDNISINEPNPFINLIYPGAKIRLELPTQTLDFIIIGMSSEFYKDMIVYNISCQDYASYIFAKQGQGLSIDYTGTLAQSIRYILGLTRKNIGYKLVTNNYLKIMSYTALSNASVTSSSYYTDYIGTSYIEFPFSKLESGTEYTFKFYVKELSNGAQFSFVETYYNSRYIDVPHTINIVLGWNEITFTPISSPSYFKITCTTLIAGNISISDIELVYNIFQTSNQTYINNALHLAGDGVGDSTSFNHENFKTALYQNLTGTESYYRKSTITLSNSNLYNAFVEIAKLYDAEIKFNYEEDTINFINTNIQNTYKGYRLSPTYNLLRLSREEDFSEFSSILKIIGSEDLNILPNTPSEFSQYFEDCIQDNFSDQAHFNTYNSAATSPTGILNYEYIAKNYVYNYIDAANDDIVARKEAIDNYAIAADFVPYLENSLYSLDYFSNTNKITTSAYNTFNTLINDNLRILNIKLKQYNQLYYNNKTNLLDRQNSIDFVSRNLSVESILQNKLAQSFDYVTVTAGATTTNYWTVNKIIGSGSGSNAVPLVAFNYNNSTTPSYINTSDKVYYGKYIDSTHIQLYNNSALTDIVSIPSADSHTWYLYRAYNGSVDFGNISAAVLYGTTQQYLDSLNAINAYTIELNNLYDVDYGANLLPIGPKVDSTNHILIPDTYTYYVLSNSGFYSPWPDSDSTFNGGIHDLYTDLNNQRLTLLNETADRKARVTVLNTLLAEEPSPLSTYQRILYEQEKAGLEALIEDARYYIGDNTVTPEIKGSWQYQSSVLALIRSAIHNKIPTDTYYLESIDGLQNLIDELVANKEELLYNLYKDYEQYIIEGYYENTDEITYSGLLEQAVTVFGLSKYPKIKYGVSIIDISALENYEYINIDIWDKILIQEPEQRLYKTYVNEAQYLDVFEINMDLRKPESTQLTVSQEDQITRILQKLLYTL